ncbi:hypothetical protein LFM09_16915 [Lentzea alba]|uniref:hypothetical protein n=1 Tax=Lentzea alba TaxID=2714351 RepID=UPI0039BF1894
MDVLKYILPAVLTGVVTLVVTVWTVRRNHVQAEKTGRRARTWELRKDDHASAQRLLDWFDQACAEVSRKPRTAAELEDLGLPQKMLELSQTARKLSVDSKARKTLHDLHAHLVCIESNPLPEGVRTGGQVDVEAAVQAACAQGREAAHALDYIAVAREAITSEWGPD